ncbi:MAG: hypothetical protein R6W94_14565 [Spirochaetia bacterium]
MNDRQNTVVATTAAALVLVTVFLCPWRVESSGDLEWSPIYQPPLTYTRTYGPDEGRSARIEAAGEATVAYGVLGLQVLAVVAAGGVGYRIAARSEHEGPTPPGH